MLTVTGVIPFHVQNLQPDTVVDGSKMMAAELVVAEHITPGVIRKVTYGNVKNLRSESPVNVSIVVFERIRHTAHTRKGFVDLLVTAKPVQFSVYIHIDHLEQFFGWAVMSGVRHDLRL